MKKFIVILTVAALFFLGNMTVAFAQQKSDRKTETALSPSGEKWYFLMSGYFTGFHTTQIFIITGPFRNEAECDKINTWTKKNTSARDVSPCWSGGN